MPRKYSEAGARPSNAGDRYHLVYVARRLLDLLHPYSGLTQLVIENVSPADMAAQGDASAFLGVDVSEYYGGEDVASSGAVELVQVKYSPLRPAEPWTRSRLVAKKKGGESVFRKLAAMFDALAHSLASSTSSAARVKIRLLTNQPLGSQLRDDLEILREKMSGKPPHAAGRVLARVSGRAGETAQALQKASRLSWTRLSELFTAWDLGGFGHPSLGRTEAELFRALSGFSRNGSEQLELLLGHLQVRATPGQRETLRRSDVLAFLRLNEDDIYPAPTEFPKDTSLFETRSSDRLRLAVQEGDRRVVIHGRSGTGKTSTLRLALQDHGGGGKAIIYDCFAGSRGLHPGIERFPYTTCFTQIINELDARYRTGILATKGLDYQGLLRQLNRSIETAAKVAEQEGHRLVLAFDAIDNAIEQERRAPAAGISFVPMLWRLELPPNCVLIVSLRTENISEVIGDNIRDAQWFEITGFNEEETRQHAARRAPSLQSQEVSFLYERTRGNPRVQSKVLDDIGMHPPDDAHRIIQATARKTAFEYYDEENKHRLKPAEVRRVLAVLYEMRQAPKLADVSAITGLTQQSLRGLIGSLSFGLRLAAGDRVAWLDQDFLDWTGEQLGTEREAARETLVNYCLQKFEQDEYARWNFSYHLLQAGQLERLVAWWRAPGRLAQQIQAAHPHEERVLDDLRAAILGALSIQQTREAFDLLLRAADIAEGRDAFTDALEEHPAVAVAADLAHLIPGGPGYRGGPVGNRVRDVYTEARLNIAVELAQWPERRETAKEVFAVFKAAKNAERVRDPENGGGLHAFELELYARYEARISGFSDALRRLEGKKTCSLTLLFAMTVGSDWRVAGESDPLSAFMSVSLGQAERAAASLGILAAFGPDDSPGEALTSLAPAAVEDTVKLVVRALTPGSDEPAGGLQGIDALDSSRTPGRVSLALGTAVENLTAAGLLEAARSLLAVWTPPKPRYRLRDDLEPYLRWAALREVLTRTLFDPAKYEPPRSQPGANESDEREHERERREIRREMGLIYPFLRVGALARTGAPAEEVSKEVRRLIAPWRTNQVQGESRSEWSYQGKVVILLEAILALPGRDIPLVYEVVEAAEHALGDSWALACSAGSDVLSRDERYLREAERLILKELEHCRPPQVPAREGVERLLYLYGPAARIHASLARRVIVAARKMASEIDSRIYARAEALTTIAEAAHADISTQRLDELCALIRYWWSIDTESARRPGERALALLAQRDPGAAVVRAWELDQRGLLDFEDGLGHVAISALAGRSLPPESIWPILPILSHPSLLDKVARSSIEQLHERGRPVKAVLKAYCQRARKESAASHPEEKAQEIVTWAERLGLGSDPEIRAMQDLAAILAEQAPPRRQSEFRDGELLLRKQVAPSALSETVFKQLPSAPRTALQRLEGAIWDDLKILNSVEIGRLIHAFLQTLPLSDRPRLAAVIERWGAKDNGIEALPLLDMLLSDGGTEDLPLAHAVAESIRRLLTPGSLTTVTFSYHSQERAALFHGLWANNAKKMEVILSAVADHLRELGSDTLYSLAGHAARLLDRADLAAVSQEFIVRTVAEAPALGNPAVPGKELQRVIPFGITLALSHPKQEIRWRAVYSIVHCLIDADDPDSFLAPLLDTLDSTDLPRWLSVREWLAFALEHVSMRKPEILRKAVPRLIPHAISRELPHAKIRHHLKQALLAVEQSLPGLLEADDLVKLKQVNRPTALVPREESARLTLDWRDWEQAVDEIGNEDRLTPEYIDTVRYWYQPLVDCFAEDETEVQQTVLRRATHWMSWLGVTRSAVEAELSQVGSRYQWQHTNNDHGSQPRVELLRLYGERHGLYLVAGELIDSVPVLQAHGADEAENKWDDWTRYDLRGGDPALPGQLIDAPPPLADNYANFSEPVDQWVKTKDPDVFARELEVPGEPDWILVAGHREGASYDRSFNVNVESALVSPPTANALARLLESDSREAFLPQIELYYGSILSRIEEELEESKRQQKSSRREHDSGDGRFVLRAWVVRFYQEAALHGFDPYWPSTGRQYGLPDIGIVRRLGWTRHPTELLWRDTTGRPVARCDLWNWSVGTGSRNSEGYRLVMRRDAVSDYAREAGLEVIFSVRLRRQGRSGYGASEGEEHDAETTRCFLWSNILLAGAERNCPDAQIS